MTECTSTDCTRKKLPKSTVLTEPQLFERYEGWTEQQANSTQSDEITELSYN